MQQPDGQSNAASAILIGLAAAIAGFLPAMALYDVGMRWLRPVAHAEEVMGRGLEAMFIGGPLLTLVFAVLTGWLVYRSRLRIGPGLALALLAASLAIAAATAHSVGIV